MKQDREISVKESGSYQDCLLPSKEFISILRKERSRYDNRDRNSLSMVVFDKQTENSCRNAPYAIIFANIFSKLGMEAYAGSLNVEETGLLLPDITVPSEYIFINSVLRDISTQLPSMRYRIISSPREENCKTEGGESSYGAQTAPIADTEGLGVYLALPTPLWKRTFDIIGSAAAIMFLSPLLLLVALIIKAVSPEGPVLFRQERIGFKGVPFMCWKFRTMRPGSDTSVHSQHLRSLIHSETRMEKLDAHDDPRIIPFGKFFRKAAIDELPQLFNVLSGDMSLVGPRPSIPYEYREFNGWHRRRTEVAQGLSGLWQVSGKNETTFSEMIRLDISYAEKRSLWLDMQIILKTPAVIVKQITKKTIGKALPGGLHQVKSAH